MPVSSLGLSGSVDVGSIAGLLGSETTAVLVFCAVGILVFTYVGSLVITWLLTRMC